MELLEAALGIESRPCLFFFSLSWHSTLSHLWSLHLLHLGLQGATSGDFVQGTFFSVSLQERAKTSLPWLAGPGTMGATPVKSLSYRGQLWGGQQGCREFQGWSRHPPPLRSKNTYLMRGSQRPHKRSLRMLLLEGLWFCGARVRRG